MQATNILVFTRFYSKNCNLFNNGLFPDIKYKIIEYFCILLVYCIGLVYCMSLWPYYIQSADICTHCMPIFISCITHCIVIPIININHSRIKNMQDMYKADNSMYHGCMISTTLNEMCRWRSQKCLTLPLYFHSEDVLNKSSYFTYRNTILRTLE